MIMKMVLFYITTVEAKLFTAVMVVNEIIGLYNEKTILTDNSI